MVSAFPMIRCKHIKVGLGLASARASSIWPVAWLSGNSPSGMRPPGPSRRSMAACAAGESSAYLSIAMNQCRIWPGMFCKAPTISNPEP